MTNWIKKITYSGVVIIVALAIEYLNSMYLHNLAIYLLNYAYLVGLLILIIGVFWNNNPEKIILHADNEFLEQRIREKIDAKIMMAELDLKNYFRKQYINNELDNIRKVRH